MIRGLAMLAALAGPAGAQGFPDHVPRGAPDVLILELVNDGYAVVTYANSADHNSLPGAQVLEVPGLSVTARVVPGGADIGWAERLSVTAPPGWQVVPPMIEVIDGEAGVVELIRGEFLGM